MKLNPFEKHIVEMFKAMWRVLLILGVLFALFVWLLIKTTNDHAGRIIEQITR